MDSGDVKTGRAGSDDHLTWDAASGLDKLMVSVAGGGATATPSNAASSSSLAPITAPEPVAVNNKTAAAASAGDPGSDTDPREEAVSLPPPPAAAAVIPPVAPTGTLVVNVDGAPSSDPQKVVKSIGAKKPVAKKGIGAKRVTSANPTEITLESFEKVEKRSAKAAQEAADFETAVAVDRVENGREKDSARPAGVSRVGAVYNEEEQRSSVYAASKPVQKGSIYAGGETPGSPSDSRANRTSNYSSRQFSATGNAAVATDPKFANKKGISSDQYFGRDKEDEAEMKGRLNKYSGASAISSDMLYNNASAPDFGTVSYSDSMAARARGSSGANPGLDVLKDSVKNFFEEVSRNIG